MQVWGDHGHCHLPLWLIWPMAPTSHWKVWPLPRQVRIHLPGLASSEHKAGSLRRGARKQCGQIRGRGASSAGLKVQAVAGSGGGAGRLSS